MKNFKWPVAVLAFVLTLGLSVGAVFLRQQQMVNEPLLKRVRDLENVKAVQISQEQNTQVITVTLTYVTDLSAAYRELNDEIGKLLGQKRYRLELVDGRDQTLEAAFLSVHLALYEGEQRGNFTEIGDKVAAVLKVLEIDEHKITVDGKNIYLQMKNGDAFLFEIIQRDQQGKGGDRT